MIQTCANCVYFEPTNNQEYFNRCGLLDAWNMEAVEEPNTCEYHQPVPAGDGVESVSGLDLDATN